MIGLVALIRLRALAGRTGAQWVVSRFLTPSPNFALPFCYRADANINISVPRNPSRQSSPLYLLSTF